jgi:hypothetical protein
MYTIALTLHSWLRWIVVILAVVTVVRAFIGWFGGREWTDLDQRLGRFFSISLDIQVLLGLILYFLLSPTTQGAFQDFGAAMADAGTRYWAVEHIAMMIIALILVHVGQVLVKRAPNAATKHRWAAIWLGLGTLVMLLAIPWPFSTQARPWIRLTLDLR